MTKNNQHLVPEIRFKGFTNAWEQRELKDVANYIRGSFPQPYTNPDFYDEENGKPFVQVADIGFDLRLNHDTKAHISKLAEPKSRFVEAGKVVVALQGSIEKSIGRTAITQYDAYFDRTILIFEEYKFPMDKQYFAQSIKKIFEKEKERAWGATISTITKEHVNDFIIDIPKIEEQQKIGSFFTQLDHLITLHQRKLDGLVTLKDGFLQQMFPAANEVVPRVRFAGFTGNWEERRLDEMLTERNEQFEESEDYPLMSFVGNVGVVPKGEQYDRSFLVKDDGKKYKKTELNDFIYSSNNLETGSIGLNRTGKAVISPVYSIFYSSNDSESLFVGLLSKRKDFINKMIHYRQGVMYGQWRIHERDFLKIIVLAPTISEQNRIIDFFKNFDEQIAAQTAKLEQLRQLKAAYLQRMFI
ncbi:restriction endonuclease subunit S [Paenibacillus silviterrae]|uniref:restriction endonuclease subunit S n=1 Tax=Paenibacillus silviterrae TaxID=3242194 RepID=UPI002542D2BF|nr:restriction endonuclease subunit S [Paenibacillus chinjuensis]